MTLPARISSAEPAATLRRIAACVREGRPIDPADAMPFFPEHVQRAILIEERDEAIRTAAETFALSAVTLATELHRYAASSWLRERTLDTCPDRHAGRLQEHLWRALHAHPHVIGERQIRRIISDMTPPS
ncbi:MAG: hypothetical protein EOR21_17205 [Mesorhizobium sp.]|nr:MAG: hypothetical protein EOR21_17205 [Mesorhizobium sp.]